MEKKKKFFNKTQKRKKLTEKERMVNKMFYMPK